MQVTLDLSSSIREERHLQNECSPKVIDLSSTQSKRTSLSRNVLNCSDQSNVQMVITESRLVDESRGSELCSGAQSLSVHTLHWKRSTDGFRCGRLKNERNSRQKVCKDTFLASSSSHDISLLQADKQHTSTMTKLPGHCHQILHFSSGHMETDTATQHNSKFRCISHNKKPPVSAHIHPKRKSFNSFPKLLFAYFLLISLFSPSLSLSTRSASTSPNLKSWSLAALETVDTGIERETKSHQVPIPDMTAIVGRLFQFQIPSSAFNGEVSSYKVCCSGCYVNDVIIFSLLNDIHCAYDFVGSLLLNFINNHSLSLCLGHLPHTMISIHCTCGVIMSYV